MVPKGFEQEEEGAPIRCLLSTFSPEQDPLLFCVLTQGLLSLTVASSSFVLSAIHTAPLALPLGLAYADEARRWLSGWEEDMRGQEPPRNKSHFGGGGFKEDFGGLAPEGRGGLCKGKDGKQL